MVVDGQDKISDSNLKKKALIQRDGLWGWIITFASFMNYAFTFGVMYSSGLFLSELVRISGESVVKVSWIFSIMNGLQMLSGPLASALTNRFGHRTVIIGGSVLGCVGLVCSSLTYSIEILFLTLGVICGTAFGLVTTPSIVGVGLYFDKRRALATGIAVCGAGIGTLLMAPMVTWLLDIYSIRGTFMILGAVYLNCILFGMFFQPVERIAPLIIEEKSIQLLDPKALLDETSSHHEEAVNKNSQSRPKKIFNFSLLKSPTMAILLLASLSQSLGFLVPYVYLSAHAIQLGFSKEASSFLLAIVGICNMFGRIMYGWLADLPKVSILHVNNVYLSLAGVIFAVCPFFLTYNWLIFYSVILGVFAVSGTAGTRPILIGYLMGTENINDGFSFNLLVWGTGNSLSIPLAGLFYELSGDSFYIAGSLMLLSGIICYPIGWVNRWEKRRRREKTHP